MGNTYGMCIGSSSACSLHIVKFKCNGYVRVGSGYVWWHICLVYIYIRLNIIYDVASRSVLVLCASARKELR